MVAPWITMKDPGPQPAPKGESNAVAENSNDLSKMLKSDLVVLAVDRGFDVEGLTKAAIIELLEK